MLWIEGRSNAPPSFVPGLRRKGNQVEIVPTGRAALERIPSLNPYLLAVTTTAALSGTYGLAVTVNDTQTLYVEDETPDGETSYQVHFALDPNSFSLNGGNHSIFQGFKNPNLSVINIDLGGQPDVLDYQITVAARHEDNTWLLSPAFSISDGAHAVEIGWGMASGPQVTDGWLRLWLDGELVYEYTQLANFGQRINTVQLGAVLAPMTDASGTYCLDAFVSAQQGYIGPGEGLSPCGMGMIASMPKTKALMKLAVNGIVNPSLELRDDRDVFLEHLASTSSIITITYTYDDLSRVSTADYSNGSSFSYAYDGAGNLQSFSRWSEGEVEMVSFVYNSANQIDCLDGNGNGTCGDPEDVSYTYDPYGNLTSDGARTYSYDAANRLVSVTDGVSTTTYAYNGDGERLSQTMDGITTTYVIDPRQRAYGVFDIATPLTMVLAETTGAETIYYPHGLDLIGQSDGVSMEYFTYDGLGSVRQVVDSAGEALYAQGFDPYGNPYLNAGDEKPNWGFTGEQSDENGLVFLRARYYEPRQGRFLSQDVWQGDYASPLSLNDWIYVEANPVNFTDPSGMFPDWCKTTSSRVAYEDCVRKFYNLRAPRKYNVYPIEVAISRKYPYGSPGCWEGPVAYAAGGYVEGLSGAFQSVVGFGVGSEIVYDFAYMEKQTFKFGYLGFADQLGFSVSEYAGVAYGFNNIEPVSQDYAGEYWFLSVGVSTDFPGQPIQLGTGATHFASLNYKIRGFAWYFSVGGSLIDPLIGADIEGGFGKTVTPADSYPTRYIYFNTTRVNRSQLITDITFGRGSPWIVPVPADLARGLGIEFAIYWSWIYEEIHSKSW